MKDYQYHIFSPYRVCPLGAHVDHQHGLVTGFAFDMGVDLWFNPTDDGSVSLRSLTFEGEVSFDVTKPSQVKDGNWGDYARGVKYALKKRFELSHGIEGVIKGSLPIGGLSSSAAVLTAYVMALANYGAEEAMRRDPALKKGLNIYKGACTFAGVAEAQGIAYTPADEVLA